MSDRTAFEAELIRREIEGLKVQYPELEDDPELFADVLEGETNLHTIMSRLYAKARDAEAMAGAVKEQMDTLAKRRDRWGRQKDAMRTLIHKLMDAAHATKLTLPEVTISIRQGVPQALITDEDALPEEYMRIKREPDKSAIRDALKNGTAIEGAALSNGEPSLNLRAT